MAKIKLYIYFAPKYYTFILRPNKIVGQAELFLKLYLLQSFCFVDNPKKPV